MVSLVPLTRNAQPACSTAMMRRWEARLPQRNMMLAKKNRSTSAIADATADANAAVNADANAVVSAQVEAITHDQAHGHVQAEVQVFEAKDGDRAPSTDRASSSAQASTQSPDQASV